MTLKRKFRPVGDRLLVRLKEAETISSGGIVMVDTVIERNKYATQEAYIVYITHDAWKGLGSGRARAKVGDLAKISKYSGENDLTIDDNVIYRAISDEDVVGVYEGEGLPQKEIDNFLQQYVEVMGFSSLEELLEYEDQQAEKANND